MFQTDTSWISRSTSLQEDMRSEGIEGPLDLSDRCLGEVVTDHRSSWVRRWQGGSHTYYVKTYDYPTWQSKARGIGRNTFLGRSRARREWDAFQWLTRHNFLTPDLAGLAERRTPTWLAGGFLVRAVLITRALDGEPLSTLLPKLPAPKQSEILQVVREHVQRLHELGFRDRNLDLRNLIAQPTHAGWSIAKIDSPRFRLVAASQAPDDELARADWERLRRSCLACGLPNGAI